MELLSEYDDTYHTAFVDESTFAMESADHHAATLLNEMGDLRTRWRIRVKAAAARLGVPLPHWVNTIGTGY